jgi:hypothetical protein
MRELGYPNSPCLGFFRRVRDARLAGGHQFKDAARGLCVRPLCMHQASPVKPPQGGKGIVACLDGRCAGHGENVSGLFGAVKTVLVKRVESSIFWTIATAFVAVSHQIGKVVFARAVAGSAVRPIRFGVV